MDPLKAERVRRRRREEDQIVNHVEDGRRQEMVGLTVVDLVAVISVVSVVSSLDVTESERARERSESGISEHSIFFELDFNSPGSLNDGFDRAVRIEDVAL